MKKEIKSLEKTVDELINLSRNLRKENIKLRQKLVSLEEQNTSLAERIQLASKKIDKIIKHQIANKV